jgi:hypothetical protein
MSIASTMVRTPLRIPERLLAAARFDMEKHIAGIETS